MEPAVPGLSFHKPGEEFLRRITQCDKCLPHRPEAVTVPFRSEMIGVLHSSAAPAGGLSCLAMRVNLGVVNHDLMFQCLDGQDVSDVTGPNGIPVGFKLDKPVGFADP